MVKTYANNMKNGKVGKCLFYPKAKTRAVSTKPLMDGILMRPYVMGGKKQS